MAKSKSTYVDGFVIVLPKSKVAAYKKMATWGEKMWTKSGALDYKECILEDAKAEWAVPFPKLLKLKPTETVAFSYITYKNKAHRNQVNKKVMAEMDKEMEKDKKKMDMPFDMKKMAYGGFKVIVSN